MDINFFGLWWIDKKNILCWQFTFQWFLEFMIWKELKNIPRKFSKFNLRSLKFIVLIKQKNSWKNDTSWNIMNSQFIFATLSF